MKLIYQGKWPGLLLREFRVRLPDGREANFAVGPGECLKEKMAETQRRFAKEKAA